MKPIVFNYGYYEKVVEENKKLKAEVANLLIRCRIAEEDKPEVVRCKDCMYWEGGCKEYGMGFMNPQTDEDDFCSLGERREP